MSVCRISPARLLGSFLVQLHAACQSAAACNRQATFPKQSLTDDGSSVQLLMDSRWLS